MLIELYFRGFQLSLAPSQCVYLHTMVQMSTNTSHEPKTLAAKSVERPAEDYRE